jgi:hypothetical protein
VITREELFLILNSCASWDDLSDKAGDLANLIELGDLIFDAVYNVHVTRQGRAMLRILPHTTD